MCFGKGKGEIATMTQTLLDLVYATKNLKIQKREVKSEEHIVIV